MLVGLAKWIGMKNFFAKIDLPRERVKSNRGCCEEKRKADIEMGKYRVKRDYTIERARVRIPFATVSKFGHFRSRHDASVDSAV